MKLTTQNTKEYSVIDREQPATTPTLDTHQAKYNNQNQTRANTQNPNHRSNPNDPTMVGGLSIQNGYQSI